MLLKDIFSCLILLEKFYRCWKISIFDEMIKSLSISWLIDNVISHVIEQLSSHETCSWLDLHMTIVHSRSLHILNQNNENQSLFIERIIALFFTYLLDILMHVHYIYIFLPPQNPPANKNSYQYWVIIKRF